MDTAVLLSYWTMMIITSLLEVRNCTYKRLSRNILGWRIWSCQSPVPLCLVFLAFISPTVRSGFCNMIFFISPSCRSQQSLFFSISNNIGVGHPLLPSYANDIKIVRQIIIKLLIRPTARHKSPLRLGQSFRTFFSKTTFKIWPPAATFRPHSQN